MRRGWTGTLGGLSNFDADPLLVAIPDDGGDGWNIGDANDDYGDLHLQDGSPCANRGDNLAPGMPTYDMDGEARVQHCCADVGADESPYFHDCNGNGTADACELFLAREENLLVNPGAETGDVDGWLATAGYSTRSGDPDPYEGSYYFFAGAGPTHTLEQTVDLMAPGLPAAILDSGTLSTHVGGYQHSWWQQADQGQITVEFQDASGIALETFVGPVLAVTEWTLVDDERIVPVGTRFIHFLFTATRQAGSNNDAYLDGAFVKITQTGFGDCNANGVPDDCDVDPNDPDGDGQVSEDCNTNGVPDECDIDLTDPDGDGFVSSDNNTNGIPDECEGPVTWYVDDDAPSDPGPGDPGVSDPLEDGSTEHPFDAIQEAVDAATDGDTVFVMDGTYTGVGNRNIAIGFRVITVRSENGPDTCVIDCQQNGRGFELYSPTVVSGFTIVNGRAADAGGGIHCTTSATIVKCRILNCYVEYDEGPIADGAGFECAAGNTSLINCRFSGNVAEGAGGAIACWGSGHVSLVNCTLTGNQAAWAGGIYVWGSEAGVSLSNCVVWDNPPGAMSVSDGVATAVYSNIEGGWAGTGNIDADPLFVDADGPDNDPNTWMDNNYRLGPVSPCIDAGDSTTVPSGVATDLDDLARFVDDPLKLDTGIGDPPGRPGALFLGLSLEKAVQLHSSKPDAPGVLGCLELAMIAPVIERTNRRSRRVQTGFVQTQVLGRFDWEKEFTELIRLGRPISLGPGTAAALVRLSLRSR